MSRRSLRTSAFSAGVALELIAVARRRLRVIKRLSAAELGRIGVGRLSALAALGGPAPLGGLT